MKNYKYEEAVHTAVKLEYEHKAPEALRLRIKELMRVPLVKPWQFIGSVLLLMATPLSFYLFKNKLVYSDSLLILLNISAGVAAFLIIFAGVAHRYADPRHKAELIGKLNSLRAKIP
ncbi:MAG: hypothetical protein JNJ69_16890 [Leptospiraceae bacterium]|nr:hypothetical protein [Leptospiraceae bacterium]